MKHLTTAFPFSAALRTFAAARDSLHVAVQGPRKDEAGQTLIEYGLILTLVSVTLIALLLLMAGDLNDFYSGFTDTVHDAVT